MGNITILYFASLGERLNCESETLGLDLPAHVSDLKSKLAERGDHWQQLLLADSTRCAVNQIIANDRSPIDAGDEVAFFPPVTGG